jgi:hypothetical protein
MAGRRLAWAQAVEVVRHRYAPCSVGRAEAELWKAWKSGEVRGWKSPIADDGLMDIRTRPSTQNRPTHPAEIDEDDLLDWLDRHQPVVQNIHIDKEKNSLRIVNALHPGGWAHILTKMLIAEVQAWVARFCEEHNIIPPVTYSPDSISRGIDRKDKNRKASDAFKKRK